MPYSDNVLVESPEDTFTKSDWLEVIGNEQPGGGEAFTLESGEATIQVQIHWGQARSFIRFALGWSYADKESPYLMRRENPVYHPRFPWLTASSVAFSAAAPVGVQGVGTKVDGVFASGLKVARYDHCTATVRFTDRPWTFLENDFASTPATEGNRNTYFDPVPSVEIISAEGINHIMFANGPGEGNKIPAPFGTLMSKITYTLNWMWVPQEYLSLDSNDTFIPSNVLSCVGRVNSAEFMGFPAGTLLLQAPAFQRFRFPISTSGGFYGYFGWNLRLPMQYFDPDRGETISATYRGHQCIPRREDLLWYGAKRTVDGGKLYPEADFNNIFKHISAP